MRQGAEKALEHVESGVTTAAPLPDVFLLEEAFGAERPLDVFVDLVVHFVLDFVIQGRIVSAQTRPEVDLVSLQKFDKLFAD